VLLTGGAAVQKQFRQSARAASSSIMMVGSDGGLPASA
jgi:hypothetical protein